MGATATGQGPGNHRSWRSQEGPPWSHLQEALCLPASGAERVVVVFSAPPGYVPCWGSPGRPWEQGSENHPTPETQQTGHMGPFMGLPPNRLPGRHFVPRGMGVHSI